MTATLERSQQAQACLYSQISASFNTACNLRNDEVRDGVASNDSYNSNSAQLAADRHNRAIRMNTLKQDRKLQFLLAFSGEAN